MAASFAAVLPTCLAAQVSDNCRDNNIAEPTDAGQIAPVPSELEPYKSIRVHIVFVTEYPGEKTQPWSDVEKQYICAAGRRFERVWSSKQFHDRVVGLPWMVLREGENVTGPQLYDLLTKQSDITIKASIKGSGKGWAISYPEGWTKISHTHIDRPNKKDSDPRGAALIGDFSDNLSHEYTHYNAAGTSQDGGVANDPRYVSYGIGCLTENLAISNNTCWFDPSRPELWKTKWTFPTSANSSVR